MRKMALSILSILLLEVCVAKPAFGQEFLTVPEVAREDVICFALYTVHDNILKLTAQLYPLEPDEDRTVRLEINKGGQWVQIAETEVIEDGWTAPFRVERWDDTRDVAYRVAHGERAYYTGTIKKSPKHKDVFVVAVFTGNSILPQHGGEIPKTDIVENLKKVQPDLLFFSGDQVYNHTKHYAAWLKFGRDFGDIIRNVPTVTIPDDHDVGMSNLWGAGGEVAKTQAGPDGGYFRSLQYVNMVQRAQTSHLPDPHDPTPVKRGITVYYTELTWGGISFAIIEDRKWKSGPEGLVPEMGPRPDHVTTPDYDPGVLDVRGAELLGDRQLDFLRAWGQDWTDAEMKVVLSQTVFAGAAHLHGQRDNRVYADLDCNGWPQSGRNEALDLIRRAYALMLCGDQHLGTVIHHGIDDWNDAGWSFCVPSIANLYLRWWAPLDPGKNRQPGMCDECGEFLDGLGNKITLWAVANPSPEENHNKLTTRAAGFGLVKLDKETRKITIECWPRNVDVTAPDAKQYPGWPITIDQENNYGRKAAAYLPTLKVIGAEDPVVQVIDEADNSVVYTLRIKGASFRPKVFKEGLYTVKVGEGDARKTLKGVEAMPPGEEKSIEVRL